MGACGGGGGGLGWGVLFRNWFIFILLILGNRNPNASPSIEGFQQLQQEPCKSIEFHSLLHQQHEYPSMNCWHNKN